MKGSSLASLGRAQSVASVGVSSKLTPAKEGSWSLKALGGSQHQGQWVPEEKGGRQGLEAGVLLVPVMETCIYAASVLPCLAFCL